MNKKMFFTVFNFLFSILKILFWIMIILIFAILIYVYISALSEKPPEHPLDFQELDKIEIEDPIYSVEDGILVAFRHAQKWREDITLFALDIVSVGKEQIENAIGKVSYGFYFPFIEESSPGGIATVDIDIPNNCIYRFRVSHYSSWGSEKELKFDNTIISIKEFYSIAIGQIGREKIYRFEEPCVEVLIRPDIGTFSVGQSIDKRYPCLYKVRIDMKTGKVIEMVNEDKNN